MSKKGASPTTETTAVQAPTRRRRTRYQAVVITLLLVISAINYMGRINLSIVIPTLMRQYSLPSAVMGVLLSIVNWTLVVSMMFSGPLVDRFHPGKVFPAGVALWSGQKASRDLRLLIRGSWKKWRGRDARIADHTSEHNTTANLQPRSSIHQSLCNNAVIVQ